MAVALYHSYTLAWNYSDRDIRRLRFYSSLFLVLGISLGVVIPLIDTPSPEPHPTEPQARVENTLEVEWIPPPLPLPRAATQQTQPPVSEKQPKLPEPSATRVTEIPPVISPSNSKAAGAATFQETFGDLGLDHEVKRNVSMTTKLSRDGTTGSTISRNTLNGEKIAEASAGIDHIKLSNNIGTTQLAQRSITQVKSTIAASSTQLTAATKQASRKWEDIVFTMEKVKGRINRIYARMLNKNPTIFGKVQFELKIAASGKVISVTVVSSSLNSPELQSKLVTILRGLNFGAKHVPPVTISYPLDFVAQ